MFRPTTLSLLKELKNMPQVATNATNMPRKLMISVTAEILARKTGRSNGHPARKRTVARIPTLTNTNITRHTTIHKLNPQRLWGRRLHLRKVTSEMKEAQRRLLRSVFRSSLKTPQQTHISTIQSFTGELSSVYPSFFRVLLCYVVDRLEYLNVMENYKILKESHDKSTQELDLLRGDFARKSKELADCRSDLDRVRAHCDRQLQISYHAADAARSEASEMKDRANTMVSEMSIVQ
jgi:hypothetical protein